MFKSILRISVIVIVVITAGLSIFQYYKYIQTKNYNIKNDRQSMIIEIPNGQYIEIIAKNDTVYDGENIQKPFSVYSKVQKNSLLESTLNVYDVYKEEVYNNSDMRSTVITPRNNNTLNVEIFTKTAYKFTENLKYGIQLDYSGQIDFVDEANDTKFEDKGCTVVIHKVGGYEYIDTGNRKTLRISQKYQPELAYDFDININCVE